MRYLVSGYYGEGNLGDEAILAGIVQEVRRRDAAAEFNVLSFSPDDTRQRHGVAALSTSLRRPFALLAAMDEADLLISGGGSFLHEADFEVYGRSFLLREGKLRPVPYFLSVILLAQSRRLPVMWYAQGLGPLHTALARRLVALAAARSAALTWRDRESAALAAMLGAKGALEQVVPDPAYALAPAPGAEVDALLRSLGVSGPFVAVCPRPWLGRRSLPGALARTLASVTAAAQLDLVLVPLQERIDLPLCEEILAAPVLGGRGRVLRRVEDARLLAGVLGRARLCVTMRLHAGILAAAGGAPAAVIDYDPKVLAFARQTGQEAWTVAVDELSTAAGERRLAAAALETARDAERRRAALSRRVAYLRSEAGGTAALAVQLAGAHAAREGASPGRSPDGAGSGLRAQDPSREAA